MGKSLRKVDDERAPERRGDLGAGPDELGDDPREVGPTSAGHMGDLQSLSTIEDASDESVEELVDDDQASEAAMVEGDRGCRQSSRTPDAHPRRVRASR